VSIIQSNSVGPAADSLNAVVNEVTAQYILIDLSVLIYFFIRPLVYGNILLEEQIIAVAFIGQEVLGRTNRLLPFDTTQTA
jgi:hypothetical protein